jgi:hypothetical protein
MPKTVYTECPHLQANPEKFEDSPRDASKQKIWSERISNKRMFLGCHDCLKLLIEAEWAKTEVGRRRLDHARRCSLVEVRGSTIYAPEGLIKEVIEPQKMPNGDIVMSPGFRINDEYPVALYAAPEPETVPETPPDPKPETPEPDAAELRAFLEPLVTANEKFVELWRQGKTGPLIGAARKAAAGKFEGKHIEKTLKEIVDGRPL